MRAIGDGTLLVTQFEPFSPMHARIPSWQYLRREWNCESILDRTLLLDSRFHSRLRSLACCRRAQSNTTRLDRVHCLLMLQRALQHDDSFSPSTRLRGEGAGGEGKTVRLSKISLRIAIALPLIPGPSPRGTGEKGAMIHA